MSMRRKKNPFEAGHDTFKNAVAEWLHGKILADKSLEEKMCKLATALLAGAVFFGAAPWRRKLAVLVNGLGIYSKPGMMAQIGKELTQRGYKVTYLNRT